MKGTIHIYLIAVLATTMFACSNIDKYTKIDHDPSIFPDYSNTVIPPNIAPLNFYIQEKGSKYQVEIYGHSGKKIVIASSKSVICIPASKWKNLLSKNTGNEFFIDVYVKNQGSWEKFKTIANTIAQDSVDSYLAYRLINTGYILWREMGIYQRNLETFDQYPIFVNSSNDEACANCHSFCMNNHKKMSMHIRKVHPGTVILDGNVLKKVNTKTNFTMSPAVYPAWHPNGNLIAYSVNLISQYFTSYKSNSILVSDGASDIILYNIKTNTVTTSPKISTKNRENLPSWSPDGKWLYYISAPAAVEGKLATRNFAMYSLCRISYDADKNTWGDVDTVLSSNQTRKSITFPKISPDGKYILFCMSDYGYFTVYDAHSDLYMMDISSGKYWKLDINSPFSESYHSWSRNSRWFVFSSKRLDGVYSRPFFAYVDKNGKVYKPFVMPQKDPMFYHSFLKNYNVPELIDGKVEVSDLQMRDLINTEPEKSKFDSTVDVDALSGATWINKK